MSPSRFQENNMSHVAIPLEVMSHVTKPQKAPCRPVNVRGVCHLTCRATYIVISMHVGLYVDSRFKIQEGLLTNVHEYIHVTKLFANQTSNSHKYKYIYLVNKCANKFLCWPFAARSATRI